MLDNISKINKLCGFKKIWGTSIFVYELMGFFYFFFSFSFFFSFCFSVTMEVALNLELTSLLQHNLHKEVLSKAKRFATIRRWVQKDNKRGGGARPKRASASTH